MTNFFHNGSVEPNYRLETDRALSVHKENGFLQFAIVDELRFGVDRPFCVASHQTTRI
jgi:hypothetical protein